MHRRTSVGKRGRKKLTKHENSSNLMWMESTEAITDKRLLNLKEPWKKGESGNPNGRGKGQRDYRTIYRAALEKIGKTKDMSPEEVEELMEQVGLDKALNGDFAFQRDIKDRLHGKPPQAINLGGADGGKLEIVIKKL